MCLSQFIAFKYLLGEWMLCVMPWFNTFKTDFMDGFLTFSCMGGGIIYSIWNFHRIFQLLRCPWGRKERLMSITYTVIQAPESVFALKSWEQWGFLWWGCTHRALGSTSCVCSLILFSNDSLRLDTVTPVLENRRTWLWDGRMVTVGVIRKVVIRWEEKKLGSKWGMP